jgi:hypothetical protein
MVGHAIEVIRQDRSSAELRRAAKRCGDGRVACRILAIRDKFTRHTLHIFEP